MVWTLKIYRVILICSFIKPILPKQQTWTVSGKVPYSNGYLRCSEGCTLPGSHKFISWQKVKEEAQKVNNCQEASGKESACGCGRGGGGNWCVWEGLNKWVFSGSPSLQGHRVALLSATWLAPKHHPLSAGEKEFLSFLSLSRLKKKLANLNRPENQMVLGKWYTVFLHWDFCLTSESQNRKRGKKTQTTKPSKNPESQRNPSNNNKKNPTKAKMCVMEIKMPFSTPLTGT